MRAHLLLAAAACLLLAPSSLAKRPTLRLVKTHREYKALLKHHKENTGLPVIVDFYSDGCGPCRQIAPGYKQMAKQFRDRAVFAKVDINQNQETSQREQIRSMPTFKFYLNGKLRHQLSGGDLNSVQQWANKLSREAAKANVRVTMEALVEYYKEVDPEPKKPRTPETLAAVIEKYGGEDGGPQHAKLVRKLTKKYGKGPKTVAAIRGKGSSKKKEDKKKKSKKDKKGPAKPNLHLATVDQLKAEMEKRQDAADLEAGEEAEDEGVGWQPNGAAPERLAIIGGGPAGLAAALYAARAGLKPVVVAPSFGGQLQGKGVTVENYPAVMGGTGPELVALMSKQAAAAGAAFEPQLATAFDVTSRPFKVTTNTSTFEVHSIILATGADARWLGVPGEHKYKGGGISTCATCDGFLFRGEDVVVIGGGDTAMEDALVLARTSKSVLVIHRRDSFRASKVLAERVLQVRYKRKSVLAGARA